jgi:repressor LexA
MALTKRQREVYMYLVNYIDLNGYSPSLREVGDGLGLKSLATVHRHLRNLDSKGLIQRDHHQSRSIEIVPSGRVDRTVARRKHFADVLSRYIKKENPKFSDVESTLWNAAR